MSNTGISLETLRALGVIDPLIAGLLSRATVKNYGDFLTALYDDIKSAGIQVTRDKHHITSESEDATTSRISMFLRGAGYSCDCVSSGGNVDIEVKRAGHRWIGEAKRYTSLTAIQEGYLQLSSRYTPGTDSAGVCYGGLLAYLRKPDAATKMGSWKKRFVSNYKTPPGCQIEACARFGPLAFHSEHIHESYGTPFKVWHVCIPLHHDPKDKSGRATKQRRTTKAASAPKKPKPRS